MSLSTVEIVLLDAGLEPPTYAHPGDAGADLRARIGTTLAPGFRTLVPTGIAVAIPEGYAGFVHPRSGLAARHGITIVNAPGVIDSGFRGEIQVNLINTDAREPFRIQRGDRIAQLVIQRIETPSFTVVDDLSTTVRGAGGHGSTGGFASGTTRPAQGGN